MLYPLYVHQDEGSAFGGSFPDFPGCFTAADEQADLPGMAQVAVETYFEGEDAEIPPPSGIARWKDHPDYQGGFWLLVEIDLSRVNAKPMRLNVSLPAHLVQRIDRYTDAYHMTPSGFLAQAAARALAEGGNA
jgi:predicted RNase H-like HicB family nuclease